MATMIMRSFRFFIRRYILLFILLISLICTNVFITLSSNWGSVIRILNFKKIYLGESSRSTANSRTSEVNLTFAHSLGDEEVTIVTAFFRIGNFEKGDHIIKSVIYSQGLYRNWMAIFKYIENPLYVYSDSEDDLKYFRKIRNKKYPNKTRTVLVKQKDLWAFQLKQKILHIFSDPDYPKHHPNTVVPEYSCTMHAKYDTMEKSIMENFFRTKYFAWVDIGYYRDLVDRLKPHYFSWLDMGYLLNIPMELGDFKIHLPRQFDKSKVAFGEINAKDEDLNTRSIMRNNEVWVGGGFFIAELNVMARWVKEYKIFTEHYIAQGLINTDQQVIYSMFQKNSISRHPFVKIQTYSTFFYGNAWFYLGFLCIE